MGGEGGLLHVLDDCVPVFEVGGAHAPCHCRRMSVCQSVSVCVISLWRDRVGGVSRLSPGPCRSCIGLALGWDCLHCLLCPRCLRPPRPLPPQRRSPESDLPPCPQWALLSLLPLLPPRQRSRFQICQTGLCCCGRASDRLLQECLQTWSRGHHFCFLPFVYKTKMQTAKGLKKKATVCILEFKREEVEMTRTYINNRILWCVTALSFPVLLFIISDGSPGTVR